jgi:hypothetical protein
VDSLDSRKPVKLYLGGARLRLARSENCAPWFEEKGRTGESSIRSGCDRMDLSVDEDEPKDMLRELALEDVVDIG